MSGVAPVKALAALAAKRARARAAKAVQDALAAAERPRVSTDRSGDSGQNRRLAMILANMPRQVGERQPQAGRTTKWVSNACSGWPHTHCPGH